MITDTHEAALKAAVERALRLDLRVNETEIGVRRVDDRLVVRAPMVNLIALHRSIVDRRNIASRR